MSTRNATLADLQLEREKLRALEAKSAFETALASTRGASDLVAAAHAVRRIVLSAFDGLTARFVDAIDKETDETRVHYLMSDVAHEVLERVGLEAESASGALPEFGERFKRGARPRDLLTVSQWADKYRWVQSGTNAPGKWSTDLTPYLREIMDSLSEHSPVRTVTFIKSSGLGGTEAAFCWLGYIMHHLQNKDVLVVQPTLELRDRSFNPRLTKMLDESPVLKDFAVKASRTKASRSDLLEYGARARIVKAGANSPDSLRSDHLPYVLCDEVDAYAWDVGGEGDPMTLIENRQRTFSRAKTYLVSTPTTAGASRIDVMYRRSDRRRYHVPCPHCGEFQVLKWEYFKWRTQPAAEGENEHVPQVIHAWYLCPHCGAEIDEGQKTEMLAAGRWIAERPSVKGHRGYHLNALYSPIGLGLGWRQVAQKWLSCQGDTSEHKAFVNTYLGEVWEEKGESIAELSLISRCEEYTLAQIAFLLITAGVDVQKNRIEVSVVAWGVGEECWLIDHIIIDGDTAQPEVWEELAIVLAEERVQIACVDAGYNTSFVYEFCRPRRWAIAIKGVTGTGRPLVEDERKRLQRLRHRAKSGNNVEPIGVDQGKALIYARLKMQSAGPGYIHFPRTAAFDDEYFAQLGAEKLVTKIRGTRPTQEWVQTRPRNEALDCLIYASAAMRLARTSALQSPAPAQSTATRPAPANRTTRSSYLRR